MPLWKKPRPTSTTEDLLEPHFTEPFRAWRASPSPDTANALLESVRPVLTEATRTYGGASAQSPSLLGKAKTMALDAMVGYDPSRAKLRTYLLSSLQGLRRHAARSESLVRVPEGAALDSARARSEAVRLADELGREPSDTELADATGLSLKRLARLRRASRPAVSEGQVTRTDEDGAGSWTPPIQGSGPGVALQKAWADVVYHDSDPVDQKILEHTFGLHGKPVLSNLEVARAVNLSPGAVSQRRVRIQHRLDLAEELGLFGG